MKQFSQTIDPRRRLFLSFPPPLTARLTRAAEQEGIAPEALAARHIRSVLKSMARG